MIFCFGGIFLSIARFPLKVEGVYLCAPRRRHLKISAEDTLKGPGRPVSDEPPLVWIFETALDEG